MIATYVPVSGVGLVILWVQIIAVVTERSENIISQTFMTVEPSSFLYLKIGDHDVYMVTKTETVCQQLLSTLYSATLEYETMQTLG